MRIILGPTKGQIVTDNPKLLKTLIDLFSFSVDGAFYSYSYRNHHWDGKKRFITDKGKFNAGLLPRLLEELKKVNITPEIEKKFHEHEIFPVYDIPEIDLRDYQKQQIETILKAKRGIVQSPTGSGKTILMAVLAHILKDKKILILFNRVQLVKQTYDVFQRFKVPNMGINFGGNYLYGNIMLSTHQSIERLVGTPMEKPDVFMVDEVHEFCEGKFTSELINCFPSATLRFGFTATVPSKNIPLYTLEGAFGPVIKTISVQELIKEGYLAKPIIQIIKIKRQDIDDYKESYKSNIAQDEFRNKIIKDICMNLKTENPKVAIITNSLSHASLLLSSLEPYAVKIEGKDPLDYREKMIKKFISTSGLSILIGTNILQTGVDIKEITHLINARGLKSTIATIQALGRALRKHTSPFVFIYDFYDDDDGVLKKHSNSRLRAYKKEGHKVEIINYGQSKSN